MLFLSEQALSAHSPAVAFQSSSVSSTGRYTRTYPIYKSILNGRKKKYGPQILELSEKLMNRG